MTRHIDAANLTIAEAEARATRPIPTTLTEAIRGLARAWDIVESTLDAKPYVVPALSKELRAGIKELETYTITDADSEFDAIARDLAKRGV